MTLLELYLRDHCPEHRGKLRFSPAKYITFLENIIYKFITEHNAGKIIRLNDKPDQPSPKPPTPPSP